MQPHNRKPACSSGVPLIVTDRGGTQAVSSKARAQRDKEPKMSFRIPVDLQTSFATTANASDQLDRERLSRVLGYIEAHLSESITVTDLANVACLSLFHFARSFTGAVGVPPHYYVGRRRLENAKAMITAGRASLYEIALDCQFSSQSSFTRAFRRVTGMTPGEYRRASRRGPLQFSACRTGSSAIDPVLAQVGPSRTVEK
jgi:AraC-like DNA-binding protein